MLTYQVPRVRFLPRPHPSHYVAIEVWSWSPDKWLTWQSSPSPKTVLTYKIWSVRSRCLLASHDVSIHSTTEKASDYFMQLSNFYVAMTEHGDNLAQYPEFQLMTTNWTVLPRPSLLTQAPLSKLIVIKQWGPEHWVQKLVPCGTPQYERGVVSSLKCSKSMAHYLYDVQHNCSLYVSSCRSKVIMYAWISLRLLSSI